MNFKIKFLVMSLFCLQIMHVQNLIGSSIADKDEKLITPPLEESEFIGLYEHNAFEEMNLDSVIAGFLESAKKRLAAEPSMEEKSTIIAKETASMYQLADEIGLDPVVAVSELKKAFAQEYPEVTAWQYLDERIKNKTRQANKPEWTDAQLQELAKAQAVYAQLLQLSKEKTGLSSQDLRDRIKNILIEYPRFHPWIQESLRNNASQFFKNNKYELQQALNDLDQKYRFDESHQSLFNKKIEFPLVINLNQNQRDYYAKMGLLGLAPVENQNIAIDDPRELKQIIDLYVENGQLSEVVAPYLVSQMAKYNVMQDSLLKAELLMKTSIFMQDLAENYEQKQALKNIFDAYFYKEIQASKNYLEQNLATEKVMKMLSPDRWSYDQRKKMNSTLYGVYRKSQELKQQKIDSQKKKK